MTRKESSRWWFKDFLVHFSKKCRGGPDENGCFFVAETDDFLSGAGSERSPNSGFQHFEQQKMSSVELAMS